MPLTHKPAPLLIALVLFCVGLVSHYPTSALAAEGEKDFELYDLQGALYDLQRVRTSNGRKVIVVDFFEVSCIPCRKAMPQWAAIHKELSPKGFDMVVVALPGPEDRATAEAKLLQYFEANPVPFRVVFDKYKNVAKQYGVVKDGSAKLPQAFLINSKGKQWAKGHGPEDLEGELREKLKAPAQ